MSAAAGRDAAGVGEVLLKVRGLCVGYYGRGGRRTGVVEGVDLDLRAGRMTALVGESGCGKSVTAAALGGLLPRGMRVDGGTMEGPEEARRPGRGLAYVFQDPGECLDPVFRIGWQLKEAMPAEERGAWRARATELLERVGIREAGRVLEAYPHQLSGGMQQRAMLAMALAGRPRILAADEPTTALDVTVQAKLLRLLKDLQEKERLAVLLITHNLGVVAEVADEVRVMYAGRIVEAGPTSILRGAAHPYVRGLLRAVPRLEGGAAPEGIPGQVPAPGRRPAGCVFRPRCPEAEKRCGAGEVPWVELGGGHGAACWRCAVRGE